MLVLALDAALSRCSVAVVAGGQLLVARQIDATQGHAARLPVMVREALAEAAVGTFSLSLVAATVGPGSFTGIRASLALAHGIALAAGVPVVGVTVGEAMADSLPNLGERQLWVAIDSRRGRVFLERKDGVVSVPLAALPTAAGKIAVAGNAAPVVASWLAAQDADVMLTDARLPMPRHIAVAAQRRLAGALPPRPALPLYVDPPEARLPAAGLRPAPAG
ncbi:MAG TPA: tRNA (adenosine(37)-N6)-threonylcarbamoyltransferase complex dimerization subunit type 1 TsaB [Acetobacteraceae bacterium]|nr:tRNA (adenosine(37)-N6)-threonylcarbamoyltransferase complex dimerization subunit type 1 TsaB [Acetobacteraceae bacterium]